MCGETFNDLSLRDLFRLSAICSSLNNATTSRSQLVECTQLFRLRNLVIFAVFLVPSPTTAAVVEVATFGDQGWKSDDTRNTSGTDLVGLN